MSRSDHTQNAGDCMLSRIEQHWSKKDIFTEDQWCQLMHESKVEKKYQIDQKGQDEIFNFEILANFLNWKNFKISSLREIVVANAKWRIKYDFTQP